MQPWTPIGYALQHVFRRDLNSPLVQSLLHRKVQNAVDLVALADLEIDELGFFPTSSSSWQFTPLFGHDKAILRTHSWPNTQSIEQTHRQPYVPTDEYKTNRGTDFCSHARSNCEPR